MVSAVVQVHSTKALLGLLGSGKLVSIAGRRQGWEHMMSVEHFEERHNLTEASTLVWEVSEEDMTVSLVLLGLCKLV